MNFKRYIKLIFPTGLLAVFFLLQLCIGSNKEVVHNGKTGSNQSSLRQHFESKTGCLYYLQSAPAASEFTQLRHKRALAANIYIHEPVIVFVSFSYTSIPYQEFYLADISEKNCLLPSLRGPPAVC